MAEAMKVRFAVAPDSSSASGTGVLAFADELERSGFDGVWLSDLPLAPTLDPLLALAMIAGRSSRLRLGANVVPLGRNPFLLAKNLAQLDQLSGGRLLLSFVPGLDQPGEREALGVNGANRGAWLEEMLGLVRSWWAGARVEHHSDRWSFSDLGAAAAPLQDPLEVWLGGRGPQALERVGRIADGWLGAALSPQEAGVARERIQACAESAGRQIDPQHFGLSIAYSRQAPAPAVIERLRQRRADVDPVTLIPVGRDGLRSFIEACVGAGLSKFVVRPADDVASWADEVQWLGDAILNLQT